MYAIAESLNVVVERNKVARRGNYNAPRRIGLHDVEVCQHHSISNPATCFSQSVQGIRSARGSLHQQNNSDTNCSCPP